jgi:hypothetical protein
MLPSGYAFLICSNGRLIPVNDSRVAGNVAGTWATAVDATHDEHNTTQGVPGISKVPIVGNLFKRKEKSRLRNELMIFVTPTIHEAPESVTWDRMINLTGSAKPDMPAIPINETQGERRKD